MADSLTRYIIVGPARSGTTITHLSLAGHPDVSALSDEVRIQPFFVEGLSVFTHGNEKAEEREKGFIALFDAITSLHRVEATKAIGFKTAISSHKEAVDFVNSVQLHFPNVKIIFTVRNDIVAQFGSLQRAKATGKWHSWVKPERDLEEKLRLNENKLFTHAVDYLQTVRELESLKESHAVFEISYENDILPANMQIYHRLFRFLGLSETEITWLRSNKVAPPPEEFIEDYTRHKAFTDKLRQRFAANPFLFEEYPETGTQKTGILRSLYRRFFRESNC